MSSADSSDYIVLYNQIRKFEDEVREFIKCKLEKSWGKGWIEQLKNTMPQEYESWEERAKKDKLSERKDLIDYMDFSDYIKILEKFDKIFTQNAEEKSEIITLLRNIKSIRDVIMHCRKGVTKDDVGFVNYSTRRLRALLGMDSYKQDTETSQANREAKSPTDILKNMVEPLGLSSYLEEAQDLLLKAYAAYEIRQPLAVLKIHQVNAEKPIEEYLEPKEAVEILKQLGLAEQGQSLGRLYKWRFYTIVLTEDGVRLAQQLSSFLIEKSKREIEEIIEISKVVPTFLVSLEHVLRNTRLFAEQAGQISSELPELLNQILEDKTIQTQLNYISSGFKKLNLAFEILVLDSQGSVIEIKTTMLPELVVYVWQRTFEEARAIFYSEFLEKAASVKVLYELTYKQKSLESLIDEYARSLDGAKVMESVKRLADEAYELKATSKLSEQPPYLLVIDRRKFERFINDQIAKLKDDILNYF